MKTKTGTRISLIALLFAGLLISSSANSALPESSPLPAFPGAEGFGSTTPGGRGGRVIPVTNLNDAGPGSLRAACDAEGPRIVIFRVSGLISLASQIVVKNPYLTIAGQTAPGDGVCLRNFTFNIATHDVVVRYLRSRLGDLSGQEADCITLASGAHDVVLDHCSTTWSIDEALSLAGNVSNVTVQWCLIAEALNHSKHTKGDHGYGSLSRANGPVTWHHNLWAHNNSRNPRLGDNYGRPPFPTFDVRNNVMYDYGETCSGLTQGVLKVNYVANYIRPGPSSKARTPIHVGAPSELSFYIRDNVFEGNKALTADNSQFFDPVTIEGKRQVETVPRPFTAPLVQTSSAREAYVAVLAAVGASLPRRDSIDAQIISDVRSGKGSIIDSQTQVGGWPVLKSSAPPVDSDGDGMPDSWERRHGLNPHDPSDRSADKDKDGYTNLEEYLNNTDPNKDLNYRVKAEPDVVESSSPFQPAGFAVTGMVPALDAANVCPDTPLHLTFASAPVVGSGKIQVFDANNDRLVDSVDVSVQTRTRIIGGLPNYNYYPLIISGNQVSIYLTSNSLSYHTTYYIKIDAGAFKDSSGNPFGGFTNEKAWRFKTKAAPPVAGAKRLVVAADGSGDFATVQGALDFVPEGNKTPITIFIRNGTYSEIIFFTGKDNLTVLGEDRKKTIIAYPNNDRFNNNAGGNPFAPGTPLPGTLPARSGAVYRRGLFLAHRVNNLTIANLTLHNTTPQGGSQAEALILNGTPKARAIITNVDLYSFQDTLQINGQAYVHNCYMEGDVDFLWGTGPTFFENCELKALRSNAYFTQVRNPVSNHGFVFKNCTFEGAPGITGNFLSRVAPARFPASEVVLIDCLLTDAVGAVGWRLDQVTQPAVEAPNVHYWEYHSHDSAGRPVDMGQRLVVARQLKLPDDEKAIANYSDPKFVLGDAWTPRLAPIITTGPRSVTVGLGEPAMLSVRAAAIPAPKYQWQRNGRNISGATQSEYEIKSVRSRDAGIYRVMISSIAGKVTSGAAKVTVIGSRRRAHHPNQAHRRSLMFTLESGTGGLPATQAQDVRARTTKVLPYFGLDKDCLMSHLERSWAALKFSNSGGSFLPSTYSL